MKNLRAVVLIVPAAIVATAKPSPVEPSRFAIPTALTRATEEFNIGPSGALLERSYFGAPKLIPSLDVSVPVGVERLR